MKTIVDWLIEMETVARDIYLEASEIFGSDARLSLFLASLSRDEDWHRQTMEKALARLGETSFSPPVTLDAETLGKLMRPFTEVRKLITDHALTKGRLLDCIIEAEFSEWNPLFLYTINSLSENVAECFDVAPKIQLHEKYIRRFIEMEPDFLPHCERFRNLPLVWKDRILVVDDEPVILKLLQDLFEGEWIVETALNGREALGRMRYNYFDVIVCDINMQEMNGITLYEEARKIWPGIGERFLFYSGNVPGFSEYFKEHNLRYMMKPATVKELRKAVLGIAHREVENRLARTV